ncbi:hypothetical protein D1007_48516 [Hordeum vulgare]|nr:hypothetical protein D1007_48516 [Hordeum vulgare]
MRFKPTIAAVIDELERLCALLAIAVAEEVFLVLVYFSALFNIKPQSDFIATMAAREHERTTCITYECVGDDTADETRFSAPG